MRKQLLLILTLLLVLCCLSIAEAADSPEIKVWFSQDSFQDGDAVTCSYSISNAPAEYYVQLAVEGYRKDMEYGGEYDVYVRGDVLTDSSYTTYSFTPDHIDVINAYVEVVDWDWNTLAYASASLYPAGSNQANASSTSDSQLMVDNSSAVKLSEVTAFAEGMQIIFGQYEQDNNKGNGKEDIYWTVLQVQNGCALLVSQSVLDEHVYDLGSNVSWEKSSLRKWLNNDFKNAAFTKEEQNYIVQTSAGNADGSTDQVFILSNAEAIKFLTTTELKKPTVSAYAKSRGVNVVSADLARSYFGDASAEGYSSWWIRSEAASTGKAAVAMPTGKLNGNAKVNLSGYGVRPAIWVSIDGISQTEPVKMDIANITSLAIGSTVEFGSFYQDAIDHMQPLQWIVLTENNGEALLLSKYGLLDDPYYTDWTEPINWSNSYARALLNGEFLIAFSNEEINAIIQHNHEGSLDYVFLLSEDEFKAYCTTDETMQCYPSAFSQVMGGGISSIHEGYAIDPHCEWWLRNTTDIEPDPEWGWDMVFAPTVGYNGTRSSAYIFDYGYVAIRPAIWVEAASIKTN